jgi:hypothetical protein
MMDTTPLGAMYVACTGVPTGPKLDPKIMTVSSPSVTPDAAATPWNDATTGQPYAVGPTGTTDVWLATVTDQYRSPPVPACVMHDRTDPDNPADSTVQPLATYRVGLLRGP